MPIIDLSHAIEPEMSVYPGDGPPVITITATIAHEGYLAQRLTLTTHSGTHLDAPAHLIARARTLDQFPASHFQGPARVVDCREVEGEIGLQHLEPLARLRQAEFVLLLTGWDRHWRTAAYGTGFPVLSPAAAAWLAGLPIKGIGVDTLSVDYPTAAGFPNHHRFLGQDKIIIENLANLDAIPGQACQLYCLPLPLKAADGAPARVIAIA